MQNQDATPRKVRFCCRCGVPDRIHGNACDWKNAKLIIEPVNDEEREWQKKVLETMPIKISYPKNLSI